MVTEQVEFEVGVDYSPVQARAALAAGYMVKAKFSDEVIDDHEDIVSGMYVLVEADEAESEEVSTESAFDSVDEMVDFMGGPPMWGVADNYLEARQAKELMESGFSCLKVGRKFSRTPHEIRMGVKRYEKALQQ